MNDNKSFKFGTYAWLIGIIAILFTGYGIFSTYQINKNNDKNNAELLKLFNLIEGNSQFVVSTDSTGMQKIDRLQVISPQNVDVIRNIIVEQSVTRIAEYSRSLTDTANKNNNMLILWAGILTLFSIIFTFWGLAEMKDKYKRVDAFLKDNENKTSDPITEKRIEEIIEEKIISDKKEEIDNTILLKIKEEVKLTFYEKEIQNVLTLDVNSPDIITKTNNLITQIKNDELPEDNQLGLLYPLYEIRGDFYYHSEDYILAIDNYTKALDIRTDNCNIYFYTGNSYYNTGNKDLALYSYTNAIGLDNENYELYYHRGKVYTDLGEKEFALNDFTKVLGLNPGHTEAYYCRGEIYSGLNRYEFALNDYNNVIELDPYYTGAYFSRGNIHYRLGDTELAKKDYSKVIELNPKYKEAFFNRGKIYMQTGLYNLAVEDYTKAIELDPGYKKAYNNRGNIYAQLNMNSLAKNDFAQVIKLDPLYIKAYISRGIVYAKENNIEKALADLNKAKFINEDNDLELKNSIDIIIEKLQIQYSQNMNRFNDEDSLEE